MHRAGQAGFGRLVISRFCNKPGDKEQAFAWLETGYEERSTPLYFLKVGPIWDPLRSDPRFNDLLRRIGLSP